MRSVPVAWATLLLAAAGACRDQRTARVEAVAGKPAPTAPVTPVSGAATAACTLPQHVWRRPAAERVVAIGDLHGDLDAARAALRAAGAIDDRDTWIGGRLVVVQTGDILDRGDDEQAIIDLFERLEPAATAAGGALIWLMGNHELMNAAGDFRYVTAGGFADFGDESGRVAALRPGGPYARIIADQDVVAIVGDTVYSHAGLHGDWASRVDEINREARCWIDGQAPLDPAPAALAAEDGPTWTRAYGFDQVDCDAVTAALATVGARRMVVGHTVQDHGITSACDGALWRIDVGLARHYMGPIEVLELRADAPPRVVSGRRL